MEQQAREPTPEQKAVIRAHMLIADTWLVIEETDTYLTVVYRHGKSKKKLDKRKDVSTNHQKELKPE